MKAINWFKKIFISLLGLFFIIPKFGSAEENIKQESSPPLPKEEEPAKARFSKDDLIQSLKKMNKNPEEIEIVCAMCYFTSESPNEMEFQCETCGHITSYPAESDQGALASSFPYIKRSLFSMPYNISIDSLGLCSKCRKDKNKVLLFRISCFNCGKEFSWEVKNRKDIKNLEWLYLKPPIKAVDFSILQPETEKGQDGIKEGGKYIYEHIFCSDCQKNISLEDSK